jgi:uncharacterized 2Fe-2S/4Fe-4S cluster protein (DUF4445 family)
MPNVTIFPFNKSIEVDTHCTLSNSIRKAGYSLKASCGDMGVCGECLVKVIKGKYETNDSALNYGELIKEGYTLACSSLVTEDIVIEIPYYNERSVKAVYSSEYFEENKNSISGNFEIKPLINLYEVSIPQPTLDDNYSDLKRATIAIEQILNEKVEIEYSALKKLSIALRENKHKLFFVLFKDDGKNKILDIATNKINLYGLSIDIGTTTIAIQLVDITTGKIIDSVAAFNKQISCGSDVISRINYSQKNGKLHELKTLVIDSINDLVQELCEKNSVNPQHIYYSVISGNTTMVHLAIELEPRFIREEPYVSTVNEVPLLKASQIGINIHGEGILFFSPCVGSYVGGDITAGLLCTPIIKNLDKNYLFIDIGTNGELVIGNKNWLVTCACSAGPAFEGSGTSCGMPAMEGAIEKINIESDKISYSIIGNENARGICGSGMIDLLSELLLNGYINKYGNFNEEMCKEKLINHKNNKAFVIVPSRDKEEPIYITEIDIANLIRTKGAIFAAISLIIKSVGLSLDDIDEFFIAGGFGKHLNIESSIRIGLFPDIDRKKYKYIGNSSLLGSYLTLISYDNKKLLNDISKNMTYLELNTEPSYMNEYTASLFLPHTNLSLFPTVSKLIKK